MGQFFPVHSRWLLDSAIRSAAKFYFVSKKNLDQKFWKFEKLEMISEKIPDLFFENQDFSQNFEKSKIYYGKSYSKIIKKSKKFDFRKKVGKFSEILSNFSNFQNFWSRFFFTWSKNLLRFEWHYLEPRENELEKLAHRLYFWQKTIGFEHKVASVPWIYTIPRSVAHNVPPLPTPPL